MSIYCSTFGFGDEHLPNCKRLKRLRGRGFMFELDNSKPCTCGSCPLTYVHSAHLPSDKDARGGYLSLGAIPNHITRDGRDNRPENGNWWPWLRVSVSANEDGSDLDTVVLTREQVSELRDALTQWLKRSGKSKVRQRIKKRSKRQVSV